MEINANWGHIQREIDNAPWGQAGQLVKKYARRFECSTDTIYRNLRRKHGKKRTLSREKRVDPENKLIRKIFDLKLMGEMMHLQRREVSTEWCINELVRQGYDEAKKLTVSTVNRRINELGYRERQPSMRIESDYANQVHMIDFTRSKYFQLFEYDKTKDDYMLTVSGKELHYKKDDARLRTWIVQYMDDYSRLRKSRAYAETNESAFLGLDHLSWAWTGGGDDPHKMRYLPLEMLRSDNGSFRKSQETKTAMDAMQVNLTKQRPGHHGGTAKIENRMRSLWQQFELPLAIRLGEGGRIWMSDYNALLYEFCVNEQSQQHPVKRNYTKGELYQQSLADRSITQRTSDVDLIRLACKVDKRKVDDHLRISLNNEYYGVPQYVDGIPTTGKRIYVHENKYGELTGKLIDDLATSSFELEPWSASKWGEFERHKMSPKKRREDNFERHGADFNEIMQGADEQQTSPADKSATLSKGDSKSSVRYMAPDTEQATPDSPFSEKIEATGKVFNSELDAREYIGIRLDAWGLSYSDVDSYFGGMFDDLPITQQALDDVIEQVGADYDEDRIADTA